MSMSINNIYLFQEGKPNAKVRILIGGGGIAPPKMAAPVGIHY